MYLIFCNFSSYSIQLVELILLSSNIKFYIFVYSIKSFFVKLLKSLYEFPTKFSVITSYV